MAERNFVDRSRLHYKCKFDTLSDTEWILFEGKKNTEGGVLITLETDYEYKGKLSALQYTSCTYVYKCTQYIS